MPVPSPDAPAIDPNSTFDMASAGKFITHIAALQLVERGLITLDDPIHPHLPELKHLNVLSKSANGDFSVKPATKKITLRHLLSYFSGIDHESNPLIKEWRTFTASEEKEYQVWRKLEFNTSEPYTTPLLYEPGEGWIYGASLIWTQVLVWRLTKVPFGKHVHDSVLKPIGMMSTVYNPEDHPDIRGRVLQMVKRDGDHLIPVENSTHGLVSSIPDFVRLMSDLLGPFSKILRQEHVDLLFEPQFSPGSAALKALRNDTENYAFPAGIPPTMVEPAVNHSLAGLVIEDEMPLSKMPKGAVTWNGMPNLIWCLHKEKGLGMVFMTQLLPVDDEKTVDLAMEFFRGAWGKFG
ncbi:uncharacterized protein PAC_14983 [Phialocephala subalpina]|uniref:Beta-lactamase-related domain-containing protein n=1 Tax=Phialocephala subalpina TaxID=576137 RepID=A0A1L7XJ83_9HELO|nr:uncharacterized protein PAC_14983 [Phialocephala subalpina]